MNYHAVQYTLAGLPLAKEGKLLTTALNHQLSEQDAIQAALALFNAHSNIKTLIQANTGERWVIYTQDELACLLAELNLKETP